MINTGQFPIKYGWCCSTACRRVVQGYLNIRDQQVFPNKMVTLQDKFEVNRTRCRDTRQDGFQMGRVAVGIKSCGKLVKYQTCSIFTDPASKETIIDPNLLCKHFSRPQETPWLPTRDVSL